MEMNSVNDGSQGDKKMTQKIRVLTITLETDSDLTFRELRGMFDRRAHNLIARASLVRCGNPDFPSRLVDESNQVFKLTVRLTGLHPFPLMNARSDRRHYWSEGLSQTLKEVHSIVYDIAKDGRLNAIQNWWVTV